MTERPTPEEMERALDGLRPAPPSDALMARLRDARPASRPRSGPRLAPEATPPRALRRRWFAVAALLIALAAVAGLYRAGRPAALAPSTAGSGPPPDFSVAAVPARATVTPVASVAPTPIFLPVETTRQLASLQAVPAIQRPDEAPRRLLRAVIIEDTTAVGAATDAALHLRRAREIYLPISNPVY